MLPASASELIVRKRLAALRRALPRATRGDAEALHQARVATRRLREVLPLLLAPGRRQRKLKRTFRRITRAIGPVRELDVALENLRELESSQGGPGAGIVRLRRAIAGERRARHTEMRRALESYDLEKLRKRTLTAAHKAHAASPGDGARRLAEARGRAARRAQRLRRVIEHAAGIYLPDRLHEVRIAAKKLRYAQEAVLELSRSRATTPIRLMKQAQDLLGRMHDFDVLIARARALQGSASPMPQKASADLDQLVRRLESDNLRMHGQYMTFRDRLLAICDRVERVAARKPSTTSVG